MRTDPQCRADHRRQRDRGTSVAARTELLVGMDPRVGRTPWLVVRAIPYQELSERFGDEVVAGSATAAKNAADAAFGLTGTRRQSRPG
jgi:hypothetical protein